MIAARRVDIVLADALKLLVHSQQQQQKDSALASALTHGALLQIHLALNCYCEEITAGTFKSFEEAIFSKGNKDFRLLELEELLSRNSWLNTLKQLLLQARFALVSTVGKQQLIASDAGVKQECIDAEHVHKLLKEFLVLVARQRTLAREE